MKVWVTKHALSSGIKEIEAQPSAYDEDYLYEVSDRYFTGFRKGSDCHETIEAALTHAEKMRQARIASLRKQIARLERLSFKPIRRNR